MARISLENPQYYLNRDTSWIAFNRRVLEEAEDQGNPLLERLKFLAISASNLDEFFEIRVAAMMQQIEDGYNEAGPDGLTLVEKRDVLARLTHEFVDEQYECWNALRPALAEDSIRVLALRHYDRFHFSRRSGRPSRPEHVSRLRHCFLGSLPRHPQQQSLSAG